MPHPENTTSRHDPASEGASPFADVARRVVRRLVWRRWWAWLGRGAMPMAGAALIAGVFGRMALTGAQAALGAGVMLVGYALLTLAWAWWRRPAPAAAMAAWDAAAGRDEQFLSAYWFERRPASQRTLLETVHLNRAAARLPEALCSLRADLPARWPHQTWLVPAALALAMVLPVPTTSTPPADSPIDADAARRAALAGQDLQQQLNDLTLDEALTEAEQKEVEQLKERLKETAEALQQLDRDTTPRDMLKQLEKRARAAEKMARQMGDQAAAKLSSAMIAALARHAATGDFADALRTGELGPIAKEAQKLGEKLERDDLSLKQQKRHERALKEARDRANDQDRRRLTAKKLAEAHDDLKQDRPKRAGRRFKDLARKLKRGQQRQQAQKRLQRLARALRGAGRRALAPDGGQLQRLAQRKQGALKPMGGKLDEQAKQQMRMALAPGRAGGKQDGRIMWGAGKKDADKQKGDKQKGIAMGGDGKPKNGQPIPVPGGGRDGQRGGFPMPGQGPGQGNQAGAGSAPMPGAGQGGQQAGTGSASMAENRTEPKDTSKTGVVAGENTGQGQTVTRRLDGPQHRESAQRDFERAAVQFIQAEEKALAEADIPLSRRQQVRQYFTALRSLIESKDSGN